MHNHGIRCCDRHDSLVVAQAIEKIPSEYRARQTDLLHGPDEFEEVFEMAEPVGG